MGAEGEPHEVLVLHGGRAVHGSVSGPEAVCQPLDLDADHNEVVQGQSPLPGAVLGHQVLCKCRSEPGYTFCIFLIWSSYCIIVYLYPML